MCIGVTLFSPILLEGGKASQMMHIQRAHCTFPYESINLVHFLMKLSIVNQITNG